jgi:hypothetical protein
MAISEVLSPAVAGVVIFALTLAYLATRYRLGSSSTSIPLPPGPKGLPIIGNLLDIPREKEWLKYRAWNAQHGDVVYAEALGQKLIVLGSAKAVVDLMERRSAVYSDRSTTLFMMYEL